jgi:hypothetical protein
MIFQKKENILVEWFDEQLLVLDLEKNLPYVLNGVAAYVLMNTDGEHTLEALAEKVCQEFDVGFHQALQDLNRLHEELISKKLVKQVE